MRVVLIYRLLTDYFDKFMLVILVPYCALLDYESFIHVDIIPLLVCYSCVALMFSFEWNKEALD